MKRGVILAIAGVLVSSLGAAGAQQTATVVEVYKSPTCRCCSRWIEHVRQSGFIVRTTDVSDAELPAFKARHGVPRQAQSCHTALVGGYVIEGHVPAVDMRRVLAERPALRGLAAVGMPRGAPGMEVWGAKPQPYSVTAFDKRGKTWVYATHGS
jgi:hypothetical protein